MGYPRQRPYGHGVTKPAYVFTQGTAVVTGAASGIGEALVHALASRGSDLALVDRDADGLGRVVHAVRGERPDRAVHAYVVDLGETGGLKALADRVLAECSPVTLLVNNAGVALGGRFGEITPDDFDWLMRINLSAPVHLTYAFLPALRATQGSHLVNVSSVFGLVAPPGQTAYSASKFALRGFGEALRHELAAAGPGAGVGVGVTTVYPGGVRTRIAENARIGAAADPEEVRRGQAQFARLLRIDPRDAAERILDGVARRKARVLIGGSAKVPDVLARLAPSHYWDLVSWTTKHLSR